MHIFTENWYNFSKFSRTCNKSTLFTSCIFKTTVQYIVKLISRYIKE